MIRRVGLWLAVLLVSATADAAAPPGKTRALTAEEEKVVAALEVRASRHADASEFEQTAKVRQQIADYRRSRQGARHWQAIDAALAVEAWRRLARVPREARADVIRAGNLDAQGLELDEQAKFAEAEKRFREALRLREKALGKDHPLIATSYHNVASCLESQGKPADALPLHRRALAIREQTLGKEHPDTAAGYNYVAGCLEELGKAENALPLHVRALRINETAFGREHRVTATSLNNVASCLRALGKPGDALPLDREALRIREKLLGKEHLSTAESYNNVGTSLEALGKSAEALPYCRQALRLFEKVLGKEHPRTASASNNVAACLQTLGREAEAVPLYLAALLVFEKLLGGDHPDTATAYNNVASCLEAQGKSAEALPLFRRAMSIRQKALGKEHPSTAASYNNVAACLHAQGKVTEALPLFRQALLVWEKELGKEHPNTASSYNNVAGCLNALGKSAEALPLYRQALQTREKQLGKEHPSTAASYNNVAFCLDDLGRPAEALLLFRRALVVFEKGLGKEHPETVACAVNLADCLGKLDRTAEAALLLQQSMRGHEVARLRRASTGFERARENRASSPHATLAVGLARLKQPRNAFRHAEASLARGLLDDLGSLSRTESARLGSLRARLQQLELGLASLAGDQLGDEQRTLHDRLLVEHGRLSRDLSDLLVETTAGAVSPLEQIQKRLTRDSALVVWLEGLGEHWACVVRTERAPTWQKLPVTAADWKRVTTLYSLLTDPGSSESRRSEQLTAFRKGWFDPLRPHLQGVESLFIVPNGAVAIIPADLLTDVRIRYAPSGSFLARTGENHRPLDASSLLAIGDPVFDKAPPADPPASGVLILSVFPDSVATRAGLQPGDVLLSIGKTKLDSIDDLSGALSSLPANGDVWRDGKTFTVRLQGSPLGATFDKRSARAAVRAWRRERETTVQRSTGHKRLPGTRLEVEAISAMVKGSTTLLGSDASEQRLDDLIESGQLKGYRILHLATHGETDPMRPDRCALILAQDRLPDPVEQSKAGKHGYDGRLTSGRIRERWKLDADLVVLSACQTGLGQYSDGEGLLGFAQAFLSRGARSVVLSRWKVDDTATSLLMIRLYENLLGKRQGVKPMGRAASLEEAKKWLRTLPRKEAERLATLHTGGVLRGSEGTEKKPDKTKQIEYKGDTPFAHPYYWAAWTLIGDPD